jgi:molybdate transport system ATP-binding protein
LAALDAPRKAEIMPYLIRLRDTAKIPILYVSHDISEVARLATTLVIIRDGAVDCAGPVADILSDPNLVPMIGAHDAGAVIAAKITRLDHDESLTHLAFSGGSIVLPGTLGAVGQGVRLRIPAQDVILSRNQPDGISAINVLPVTITEYVTGKGPGVAVGLQAGQDRILARITRQSFQRLGLAVGDEIYAILKATAVAATDTDIG